MEPVEPEPPVLFNVRVDHLSTRGDRNGRTYLCVKGHHTFGHLIMRTCAERGWGDHNKYIWTSGTVTLYEYDNDQRVQMWAYGLPPRGQVMSIIGQTKGHQAVGQETKP